MGIEKSDFVYLFVGRLVKDKGINELIEVFKKIASEFKNTNLFLAEAYEKDLDPAQSGHVARTLELTLDTSMEYWVLKMRPA